jgi:hypothetical protein
VKLLLGSGDFCLVQPNTLHSLRGQTATITPYVHLDIFYNPRRQAGFPTRGSRREGASPTERNEGRELPPDPLVATAAWAASVLGLAAATARSLLLSLAPPARPERFGPTFASAAISASCVGTASIATSYSAVSAWNTMFAALASSQSSPYATGLLPAG